MVCGRDHWNFPKTSILALLLRLLLTALYFLPRIKRYKSQLFVLPVEPASSALAQRVEPVVLFHRNGITTAPACLPIGRRFPLWGIEQVILGSSTHPISDSPRYTASIYYASSFFRPSGIASIHARIASWLIALSSNQSHIITQLEGSAAGRQCRRHWL
jgi:hypothetical protein